MCHLQKHGYASVTDGRTDRPTDRQTLYFAGDTKTSENCCNIVNLYFPCAFSMGSNLTICLPFTKHLNTVVLLLR